MVMPGLYQIWTRITPSIDHSCVKRRDPWKVRHYVNYLIHDHATTCQGSINLNTEAHFEFWKYHLFCLKKHKDICVLWSCQGPTCRNRKRCQIKVQFESGAKKKILAALFQPTTSISDYQSVPWSHCFQNIYNTHMCKMYLTVEKWGFS